MLKIQQLLKCLKGLTTTTMNNEELCYSTISPNGPFIVFTLDKENMKLTPVAQFFDEERAIEYVTLKKNFVIS